MYLAKLEGTAELRVYRLNIGMYLCTYMCSLDTSYNGEVLFAKYIRVDVGGRLVGLSTE